MGIVAELVEEPLIATEVDQGAGRREERNEIDRARLANKKQSKKSITLGQGRREVKQSGVDSMGEVWGGVPPPKSGVGSGMQSKANQYAPQRLNPRNITLGKKWGRRVHPSPPRGNAPALGACGPKKPFWCTRPHCRSCPMSGV